MGRERDLYMVFCLVVGHIALFCFWLLWLLVIALLPFLVRQSCYALVACHVLGGKWGREFIDFFVLP